MARRNKWPTPTASDANGAGSRNLEGSKAHAGVSLTDAVRTGNSTTPRRWPTPTVQDAANNGGPSQFDRNSLPLNAAVHLFPTPRAEDAEHNAGPSQFRRNSLPLDAFVKVFPTPTVRDSESIAKVTRGAQSAKKKGGGTPLVIAATEGTPPSPIEQLNPRWVAVLMGFPPDWLD